MADPNPGPARRICKCSARCGASGKAVSVATYNRHTQARMRDLFGASLDATLESIARERRLARGTETTGSGLRGTQRSRGHINSSRQQRTRKTPANKVVGDGRKEVSRQMESQEMHAPDVPLDSSATLTSPPEAPPPNLPLRGDHNNNDSLPDVGCLDDSGYSAQQPPSPQPRQDNPVGPQNEVQNAKLGDTTPHFMLSPDLVSRIRNASAEPLDVDDRDLRLSLRLYLATANEPPETYIGMRELILERYLESKMLSFEKVKRLVATAELSGVYPIARDMCADEA